MSHPKQTQEHDAFLKTLAEELLAMSDSEILDGDDPSALRKENMTMVAKAKTAAGRRRLAAGRSGFVASQSITRPAQVVSVAMARAAIEAAMNDGQYTLAARSLVEMSDEDILSHYNKMVWLKAKQDAPDGNQ